jgi:hypothetical protein
MKVILCRQNTAVVTASVQNCFSLLQKKWAWCVMLSALKKDAGVQALTSASRVRTSVLVTGACQIVTLCQGK